MRKLFGRSRKRLVRFSLLTANLALLAAVVFIVTKAPSKPSVQLSASANPITDEIVTGPLDQVSSAEIAVHIARVAGLPESTSVVNYADSVANVEATEVKSVVSKPQVAASALATYKDIQEYVAAPGDTVASVAAKFGVSSDSVKWSNSLTSNTITAGKKLVLPPAGTNGIVYTVAPGDTPTSLAQKYGANEEALVAFNDAEVSGLTVGRRIFIPNGVIAAPVVARATSSFQSAGFAWGGSSPIYGGGNAYDYGWCTYYAASRVAVPSNWGNANTWDNGARASGWTVSPVPVVGAVAQTDRMSYFGHVAYVEAVSEDGTKIKYSDMNGIAGWGRVGHSDWVPASTYQNYIYR